MLLHRIAALAVALALQACSTVPPTQLQFSFGLWGDMPYKKTGDDAKLPAVLQSIGRADIRFSIYNGDIKDGSSPCTDSVFTETLAMFNSLPQPVVYVPGDNEWTDCHRLNNGGYDTLERLAYLRRVMYPSAHSLGQRTMPLEHQGALGQKYVENTRFSYGSVVYAGFNMPGSSNNAVLSALECSFKSARNPAQCEAANAEYQERDRANVQWLSQTFAAARASKARGVVLVFQADPGFDLPETEDVDESQLSRYNGYRNFLAQVVKETEQFAGQVLLVHGDTHYFKVDKPLYSPTRLLPNLTRLQTFGSPQLHWVRVTVDPATEQLFWVQPVIVQQP